MSSTYEACPICQRMDGGHDMTVYGMAANNGQKQDPTPGDSPTGEQQ